tara:strand:- start:5109 stop:5408 length:300 start_codon:yes stop_codon:yes gene_type:complete
MDKPPRKPRGGVKNKLGYKNINYLQNIGGSTEWFIVNYTKYSNRYVKSFETLEEAVLVRNNMYSMYGLPLPVDDLIKFKKFETRFLKKCIIKYEYEGLL